LENRTGGEGRGDVYGEKKKGDGRGERGYSTTVTEKKELSGRGLSARVGSKHRLKGLGWEKRRAIVCLERR